MVKLLSVKYGLIIIKLSYIIYVLYSVLKEWPLPKQIVGIEHYFLVF